MTDQDLSAVPANEAADEAAMRGWAELLNRPLDAVYPVLLIDAIVVKVRGSQVANRPVCVAIGVDLAGERDVLGLWLGPTGGEGAKQWVTMLTELRNRGLADALIVCCDGLRGLLKSIRAAWPDATMQTCVVHMVRIDRPWRLEMGRQSLVGFRLIRRRCVWRALATRSCRAVSSVQPRALPSSRRTRMSASCSVRMSARCGSGAKLSHCSQMLA